MAVTLPPMPPQLSVSSEGHAVLLELDGAPALTLRHVAAPLARHPLPTMRIAPGGLLWPPTRLLDPVSLVPQTHGFWGLGGLDTWGAGGLDSQVLGSWGGLDTWGVGEMGVQTPGFPPALSRGFGVGFLAGGWYQGPASPLLHLPPPLAGPRHGRLHAALGLAEPDSGLGSGVIRGSPQTLLPHPAPRQLLCRGRGHLHNRR